MNHWVVSHECQVPRFDQPWCSNGRINNRHGVARLICWFVVVWQPSERWTGLPTKFPMEHEASVDARLWKMGALKLPPFIKEEVINHCPNNAANLWHGWPHTHWEEEGSCCRLTVFQKVNVNSPFSKPLAFLHLRRIFACLENCSTQRSFDCLQCPFSSLLSSCLTHGFLPT